MVPVVVIIPVVPSIVNREEPVPERTENVIVPLAPASVSVAVTVITDVDAATFSSNVVVYED